tara:strand:+ start:58 stop:498 length:441 start_codon:yes stop_codon:yes gene_type:complete
MNDEIRRNIRNRWIESIFELAHSEFQNRLWIEADYENSVGDFTECVCSYFDDLNLDDGYSEFIENGIVSESEFGIVSELHSEFDKYVENTKEKDLSDKDVLKDIEWIAVTNLGLKAWNRLKENMKSISDKEKMMELEKYYLNKNAT